MDITKLELAVKNSKCIRQVILFLSVADSSSMYKTIKRLILKHNISTAHFWTLKEIIKNNRKIGLKYQTDDNVFTKNSKLSRNQIKKFIIDNNKIPYYCSFCKQTEFWKGCKISLILDHINGIRDDNRLENLRFLCPNCNATLATHCRGSKGLIQKEKKVDGRTLISERINLRKIKNRPSLAVILTDVQNLGYVQTGRKYGVSDNAIRKWIKIENKKLNTHIV